MDCRHCEERSDVAIQKIINKHLDSFHAGLPPTLFANSGASSEIRNDGVRLGMTTRASHVSPLRSNDCCCFCTLDRLGTEKELILKSS
jgi:hypothetical protein